MYSRLLDAGTLAKVIGAAPDVVQPPASEARMILRALYKLTATLQPQAGMNGMQYRACLLADLPGMPEALTPKRIGILCREMGLVTHRRNVGYEVAWSDAQLTLLIEYFRLELLS